MSGLLLEAFNGVWAILAAFCVVFLVDHLWWAETRLRFNLRGWFLQMNPGVQVAVASLGICLGVLFSRGSIWYWRWAMGGDPLRLGEVNAPLALGAFAGSWAFLCLLRVVSRPRGRWPVIAAIVTVVAYLATFTPYVVAWVAG